MARRTVAPTTNVGWAALWLSQGFHVVPLFPKSKKPCGKDWHRKALFGEVPHDALAEVFAGGKNVGLLMGTPDGRRVDADFDCPEVRQLRTLLPATGLTFGRVSLDGVTHCIYEAEEHEEGFTEEVYYDYIRNGRREAHKLLELRYTGRQTMAPGSIHPDTGEPIICGSSPPAKPAIVSLARLRDTCRLMAAITIVKRQWPGKGSRGDYAMWVLGGLIWHGVPAGRAQEIVTRAAALAGDEEYRKRGSSANRAADKVATGAHVRGFGHLETVFDLPGFGKALLDALRHTARKEKIADDTTGNPVELVGNKPQPRPRTHAARLLIERPYVPFPTHALPSPMREMVEAVADARNVDPAMVALPSLAAAASLIGTSHMITPNGDWKEFPCIWNNLLCETGSRKSAGFEASVEWMDEEQARIHDKYISDKEADAEALLNWKDMPADARGPKPKPTARKLFLYTDDATVESLPELLAANVKGVGYIAEEIRAFYNRIDQYSGGNAAYFLKMYDGKQAWNRNRVGGDGERWAFIRHPLMSMSGTIQPMIFKKLMTDENTSSGLLARCLLAMPYPRKNTFQRHPSHVKEMNAWKAIQAKLWALTHAEGTTPRVLPICPQGVDLWEEWHNHHAEKVFNAVAGIVKGADAKLWGQALRLALIHALITDLHNGTDTHRVVSVESVEAALTLANWFSNEHSRIYWWLLAKDTGDTETLEERIVRFFRRHPEKPMATATELRKALADKSGTVNAASILEALEALVAGGMGAIVTRSVAGGDRVEFTVNAARLAAEEEAEPDAQE